MKKTTTAALNRAEIFRAAWTMTRAALEKWPEADRRATFAAALRLAWEDARSSAAQEAQQAPREEAQQEPAQPETLQEFYALPGEAQLDLLRKFASRCPSYAARAVKITEDPETGEKIKTPAPAAWADWMIPRSAGGMELEPWEAALDTIAAEAWTRLDRQPEDLPLGILLARAARAACQRLSNQYRDKPSRSAADAASLDDPDFSLAAHLPSPEPAALNRAEIESYARSPEDLFTVKMTAAGYSHIEIAGGAKDRPQQLAAVAAVMDLDPQQMKTGLGVSRQAVEKRLEKMQRRRSAEARNIEAWMSGDDLKKPEPRQRPRIWSPDNASSNPGTVSTAAAALHTGSKPAPKGRPQAAQERPQAEPMTRSTGSSAAAQDAAKAAETAAETARREAVATRSLAKLAARQARSAARSR